MYVYHIHCVPTIQVKKVIVVVDAITNGMWAIMWLVAFIYLANEWRKTSFKNNLPSSRSNCANSGLAFSFFAIFIWVSGTSVASSSGWEIVSDSHAPMLALASYRIVCILCTAFSQLILEYQAYI